MKLILVRGILTLAFCFTWHTARLQQPPGGPPDAAEMAKVERVHQLRERAYALARASRDADSIPVLLEAREIERSRRLFCSTATYDLARTYLRLGREPEALEAYKQGIFWDADRGDIHVGRVPWVQYVTDYAILLSKNGKHEEAKALYYYAMRNLNSDDRHKEPGPFWVVFDPEPEGVVWEYSPQRLEAAALMILAMHSGSYDFAMQRMTTPTELIARVKVLAPDWFYPSLFTAAKRWNASNGPTILDRADSMALPGIEKEIVAGYRVDHAEHKALNITADTPDAWDSRPMTRGAERRARMQCLRPNAEVLRRISIPRPGR